MKTYRNISKFRKKIEKDYQTPLANMHNLVTMNFKTKMKNLMERDPLPNL